MPGFLFKYQPKQQSGYPRHIFLDVGNDYRFCLCVRLNLLNGIVEQAQGDNKPRITIVNLILHSLWRISGIGGSKDTPCLQDSVIADGERSAVWHYEGNTIPLLQSHVE